MNGDLLQQQATRVGTVPADTMSATHNDEMLKRIGHVTRVLHDSLSGLGLKKIIEQVAQDIPGTHDRLDYVARMTEQAAERVLNATDVAIPLLTELAMEATALEGRWKEALAKPSLKNQYNQVADETLAFLTMTEKHTTETKALLMDIMMAQDFQDLTGQVIKKIMGLTQDLEKQLVQVLVDFSPGAAKKETNDNASLMNGPQINPENAVGVVSNQTQVDDLLDSLGL